MGFARFDFLQAHWETQLHKGLDNEGGLVLCPLWLHYEQKTKCKQK